MAPFMKQGENGMKVNWQRLIELFVIAAINAAVIITTLQIKLAYHEKTIDRLEQIVALSERRITIVETQAAICMDRLNMPRNNERIRIK